MSRQDLDALIQGALDHALAPEEQAQLARMISESPAARERAAQFQELAALIESLGPADAPLGLANHVLSKVSHHPRAISPSTFPRGVAVNKKILFGLAAAAVIVLAVITYNSNPPATEGTEATIGAAQRAQAPQINPSDVKLGDTATQDVLQTETFDAIMKDETLRTLLQDAELRKRLQDAELRKALQDDGIRRALADPNMARRLQDEALRRALNDPELRKKFDDANMRALLANRAFADALRDDNFRKLLMRAEARAALAGDAMARALRDPRFDAALRSPRFAESLARGARVQ
jgi:hypothetical protein